MSGGFECYPYVREVMIHMQDFIPRKGQEGEKNSGSDVGCSGSGSISSDGMSGTVSRGNKIPAAHGLDKRTVTR